MNFFNSNIKQHSGIENQPGCDFFAAPPMQIGQVQTAQTSLLQGQDSASAGRRLISIVISSVICLAIAGFLIYIFSISPKDLIFYILTSVFLGLGLLIGAVMTSFSHTCTYVGENGVAKYFLKKNRYNQPTGELFEFGNANAMYVETTRNFTNGAYTGTTYNYRWVDQYGKNLYRLNGSYSNKNGEPKNLADPYYFAKAAANSWNHYKLVRYIDLINQGRTVIFNIKKMTFEMGLNMMNVYESGNKLTWNINDINSIQVEKGWVTIFNSNYQEIGWFSKLFGKGKITFMYSEMPNANLFLLLFEILYKKPIH